MSLDHVAKQIPMDARDLRKVVLYRKHDFVGLGKADRILMALGVSVAEAERDGLLHAIPGRTADDARRMAEDEFFIHDFVPTPEEIETRAQELIQKREYFLSERPATTDSLQGNDSREEELCATYA